MIYLVLTSLLWAFSFGLVKKQLAGVDPAAISTLRLALATLGFLPFLRLSRVCWSDRLKLAAVGAIEFGLMYIFYLESFNYLKAFEIALFTVFTPFYVVLVGALLERQFNPRYLWSALLAAVGALIVLGFWHLERTHVLGFLIVQICNLCFAIGQVSWCRLRARMKDTIPDHQLIALPYAGGLLAAGLCSLFTAHWGNLELNSMQWISVIYLGIVASGICFLMWNLGARQVNTGTLATMNNLKMPLAIACSLLFFQEKADLLSLLLGGTIILVAIWLSQKRPQAAHTT